MAEVGGITGDSPYIQLGDLEFTDVRKNLRDFLSTSGYFSDYDFEGSALSTLLDLLAYNSSLYGFYANMIANESFLDTAQQEESIYSLVKPLGYLPVSRRGARAQITVNGTATEIKPGDLFTGKGLKWTPSNTYFVDGDVSIEVYQGQYVDTFLGDFDYDVNHQKFVIPSSFVDTTTLDIYVDEGSGEKKWTNAKNIQGNITGLTGGSEAYFLTTSTDGRYAVYFGDNFVGRKPKGGSNVYAKFYETAGDEGNQAVTFISGVPGIRVIGTEVSGNSGTLAEDMESVRTNAPLYYQTQGRYVTATDHKVGLLQEEAGLVANVWGGEDNDPPNYGRVYVSALGIDGTETTPETQNRIVNIMKEKGVITILPEFVPPNQIDLSIRGNVFFDPTRTGSDSEYVRNQVVQYIDSYLTNDFNINFNFSVFSVGLTLIDDGIVGETLTVYLEKSIEYEGEPIQSMSISFRNTLADSGGLPGTVIQTPNPFLRIGSNGDPELVYMIDDGYGGIRIYSQGDGAFIEEVGSINYATGRLQIDNLNAIQSFTVEARPRTNTVIALGANLLTTKDGGVELVTVT